MSLLFESINKLVVEINNFIPENTKPLGIDTTYIYSALEIITMVITIVLINAFSHTNMLIPSTIEGGFFITFIILIFIDLLYIFFYTFFKDLAWIFSAPYYLLYPLTSIYSLALWIISKTYNIGLGFFENFMVIFKGLTDEMGKMVETPDGYSNILKYGILYAVIIFSIIILTMLAKDPTALTVNTYIYAISIIVPILFVIFYAIPIIKSTNNSGMVFFTIGVIASLLVSMFYFYMNMSYDTFATMSYLILFLSFLILICGLAIFFYIFSNYLKSLKGLLGFLTYFIFYIPCLLIDFVQYLLNEFKSTSNAIYVLFFIEIILLIVYIYIPKLINWISYKDGIVLLEKSTFLNIHQTIGSSNTMILPRENDLKSFSKALVYRENYAFSMWVNLNVQPPSFAGYAKESVIFDCGNGKPKITYYNDMNDANKKNKYIVYFTDSKKGPSSYEIEMPSQKWNNIVFNYTSSKVDLFINGNLERTFTFNKNRPKYNATDFIDIGSDDGLDGAICNVRYYTENLTSSQIANAYNLLMNRNPPVNIL
jgi:hypothetical protein